MKKKKESMISFFSLSSPCKPTKRNQHKHRGTLYLSPTTPPFFFLLKIASFEQKEEKKTHTTVRRKNTWHISIHLISLSSSFLLLCVCAESARFLGLLFCCSLSRCFSFLTSYRSANLGACSISFSRKSSQKEITKR